MIIIPILFGNSISICKNNKYLANIYDDLFLLCIHVTCIELVTISIYNFLVFKMSIVLCFHIFPLCSLIHVDSQDAPQLIVQFFLLFVKLFILLKVVYYFTLNLILFLNPFILIFIFNFIFDHLNLKILIFLFETFIFLILIYIILLLCLKLIFLKI